MYKSALLIVNPRAGKTQAKNNLYLIVKEFEKNNYNLSIYKTKNKTDTISKIKETSKNYDLIICYGGDGTLNDVVMGMTYNKTRPSLGYIPAGTTNDIASSLNISKNNIQAARDIIWGSPKNYDLGLLNNKVFLYIAAFGLLSGVSYTTPQNLKNMFGRSAYFFESIKQMTNYKSYHLKISYDNKIIEDDFIFGSVSNSTTIAGALKLKRDDVKFDDGLFEVILVKTPSNILEFKNIVDNLSKQKYNEKNILFFQASSLKILSETSIRWCLDGEDGGLFKEAEIINKQKNIELIIKKQTSA